MKRRQNPSSAMNSKPPAIASRHTLHLSVVIALPALPHVTEGMLGQDLGIAEASTHIVWEFLMEGGGFFHKGHEEHASISAVSVCRSASLMEVRGAVFKTLGTLLPTDGLTGEPAP